MLRKLPLLNRDTRWRAKSRGLLIWRRDGSKSQQRTGCLAPYKRLGKGPLKWSLLPPGSGLLEATTWGQQAQCRGLAQVQ